MSPLFSSDRRVVELPISLEARAVPAVKGFTLTELLLTVAIASILLSLAAPSFSDVVKNAAMISTSNSLSQSIKLARSEAIKRSQSISICARESDSECDSENDWSKGWLLYTDPTSTGTPGSLDTTDTIIRVVSVTDAITLSAKSIIPPATMATVGNLRFNPRGTADWSAGTFTLCDLRGASDARAIIVRGSGSVRVAEKSGSVVKDAVNSDIEC